MIGGAVHLVPGEDRGGAAGMAIGGSLLNEPIKTIEEDEHYLIMIW